jgi:hypothetical protein
MKLLTILLILMILGLYFYTEETKGIIRVTGHATLDAAKSVTKQIVQSQEFKEIKNDIINKTVNSTKGVQNGSSIHR